MSKSPEIRTVALDNLVEALSGPPPKDKRTSCYYTKWLAQLSPEVQQAVEGAMQDRKWKTVDLHDLFKKRGYEREYNSLRVHRSGRCSCGN